MRKPTVINKYNLSLEDCRNLFVVDRDKVCAPLFWRNDIISAWCINETTACNEQDDEFCTYDEFWLGVYDEDAKAYAGKVCVGVSAYGGMCNYTFDDFFNVKDIENEHDLRVQEMLLETINRLIDDGVLATKQRGVASRRP